MLNKVLFPLNYKYRPTLAGAIFIRASLQSFQKLHESFSRRSFKGPILKWSIFLHCSISLIACLYRYLDSSLSLVYFATANLIRRFPNWSNVTALLPVYLEHRLLFTGPQQTIYGLIVINFNIIPCKWQSSSVYSKTWSTLSDRLQPSTDWRRPIPALSHKIFSRHVPFWATAMITRRLETTANSKIIRKFITAIRDIYKLLWLNELRRTNEMINQWIIEQRIIMVRIITPIMQVQDLTKQIC